MTDRDESSKGFLERWSRKKIDAEREMATLANTPPKAVSPQGEVQRPYRQVTNNAGNPAPAVPKPEFDLTSLPSLDSITAITDVRAFLNPGVPTDLARAALRRAWAADPAIRDFKGLAENDWDFTDPTAMPGFEALPPGTDIKKMVAQIFGESEKPPAAEAVAKTPATIEAPNNVEQIASSERSGEATTAPEENAERDPATMTTCAQQVAESDIVQRDNNTASHNNSSGDDAEEPKKRRHHGGALPQ